MKDKKILKWKDSKIKYKSHLTYYFTTDFTKNNTKFVNLKNDR